VIEIEFESMYIRLLPLLLLILVFVIFSIKEFYILSKLNFFLYKCINNFYAKFHYDSFLNRIVVKFFLKAKYVYVLIDKGVLEFLGPTGVSFVTNKIINLFF